jgi:FkbM family methyltransferase
LTADGSGVARANLLDELGGLLDEDPAGARGRERALRAEIQARPDVPVVLFGAGNLGRRTASLLRSHGRPAAAFIDNEPATWGRTVEGVPVLSPDDASKRFAGESLAIVTIWRAEGGHHFSVTRADLRARGWRRVESFIPLFWGYQEDALPYITIDLPTKVLAARDQVLAAAELWSDEWSLREYVAQVRWRLSGDLTVLSGAEPDQYFAAGIVRVGRDEVYADCGAFTGDTLLDIARRVGAWRAYHAFEPDPASFAGLEAAVGGLPPHLADRVRLHLAATSDRAGTARFDATGSGSASLSDAGTFEVDCVTIDDVMAGMPPTFIKMDIEGGESAALAGAVRVIRKGRPILAIAAYHKQADLWELPRQVTGMVESYEMFLRPHVDEGFDTVLYAIPDERLHPA